MGCSLPTTLSGTGDAEIGIQINGVSSLTEISKVSEQILRKERKDEKRDINFAA